MHMHVGTGDSRAEGMHGRRIYSPAVLDRLCCDAPFRRSLPSRLSFEVGAVFAMLEKRGEKSKSCFVLRGKDKISGR